jgi:glycosyltransferase involved in cell wall biosynthesis
VFTLNTKRSHNDSYEWWEAALAPMAALHIQQSGEDSTARKKRPLRVCHVIATTEGATWAFEQVRDLRDRYGYEVCVVLNGTDGALVDRFNNAGIRVLASDFEFLNPLDLFALPKKIVALARVLRRERFDVVQTHLFHSMVIGRLAAWLADTPVRLSTVAGPFHLEAYTPRWIDASTQWMETALIPSCEFSRTLYRTLGVSDDRLRVIYYGPDETKFDPSTQPLDLRLEFGWAPATPVIGMVAYFYSELGFNRCTPPAVQGRSVKSQADLISAMPFILERYPDAKLVFAGSGWEDGGRAYKAKMEALTQSLGLGASVKFLGFRHDVPAILKGLDVAVQASASENLGGSIEALLMECPTVATRTGGLVDSVIDGETGVLVAPFDPHDLAHGIVRLLDDRDAAHAMARRGRQLMLAKFTLARTVENLDLLYRSFPDPRGRGYSRWHTIYRALIGAFVCAYLAGRYLFIDLRLLPAVDAGWRPWHLKGLRRAAARIGRVFIREQSEGSTATSGLPVGGPAKGTAGPTFTQLMLWRLYAAVGRRKLGWGLRRRMKIAIKRIIDR